MAELGQQLWTRPVYPHPDNEEFEGDFDRSEWVAATSTQFGVSWGDVDAFDTLTSTGLRVNVDIPNRKSWGIFQASSSSESILLAKPVTLVTNVLMVARLKFHMNYADPANNDGDFGFLVAADTGGIPDKNNRVNMLINEVDPVGFDRHRAQFEYVLGGAWQGYRDTTDTNQSGSPLEYAALHKIGSDYHGWFGTASGNWIYMGTRTPPYSMGWVGFFFYNINTSNPGSIITGCDFIRFYETDNFLF